MLLYLTKQEGIDYTPQSECTQNKINKVAVSVFLKSNQKPFNEM